MQQLDNYLDNLSPHWINYAILDDITDRFVPLVEAAQSEVDTIDDLVLILSEAEQGDMLRRIANVRKQVMTLQRLMASKIDVLRVLLKRLEGGVLREEPAKTSGISSARDTILYLGDVQDRMCSGFEVCI